MDIKEVFVLTSIEGDACIHCMDSDEATIVLEKLEKQGYEIPDGLYYDLQDEFKPHADICIFIRSDNVFYADTIYCKMRKMEITEFESRIDKLATMNNIYIQVKKVLMQDKRIGKLSEPMLDEIQNYLKNLRTEGMV